MYLLLLHYPWENYFSFSFKAQALFSFSSSNAWIHKREFLALNPRINGLLTQLNPRFKSRHFLLIPGSFKNQQWHCGEILGRKRKNDLLTFENNNNIWLQNMDLIQEKIHLLRGKIDKGKHRITGNLINIGP